MNHLKSFATAIVLLATINTGNAQFNLDFSGFVVLRSDNPSLYFHDVSDARNEFRLYEQSDDIRFESSHGDLVFRTGPNGGVTTSTRVTIKASDGNVGIGTSTPDEPLSFKDELGPKINLFDATGIYGFGMASAELQIGTFDDTKHISLGHFSGSNKTFVEWMEINTNSLQMTKSGAYVTAGGVWTDASSRSFKENITNLTLEEATLTLAELTPVKFNYKLQKDEEYLGFIAEDVPALVATADRKGLSPMDIVAVLTKIVQKQQSEIADLRSQTSEISDLKEEMAALRSILNAQIQSSSKE